MDTRTHIRLLNYGTHENGKGIKAENDSRTHKSLPILHTRTHAHTSHILTNKFINTLISASRKTNSPCPLRNTQTNLSRHITASIGTFSLLRWCRSRAIVIAYMQWRRWRSDWTTFGIQSVGAQLNWIISINFDGSIVIAAASFYLVLAVHVGHPESAHLLFIRRQIYIMRNKIFWLHFYCVGNLQETKNGRTLILFVRVAMLSLRDFLFTRINTVSYYSI